MTYDARSLRKLAGVHPDLVRLGTCVLDMGMSHCVTCGRRTAAEQREMVRIGASHTLESRHLTGHAIDVAPRPVRWDWPLFFNLARRFQIASAELQVPVVWGGVWDRQLADLDADLEHEVAEYDARMRAAGKRAFADGPHFELPRDLYP